MVSHLWYCPTFNLVVDLLPIIHVSYNHEIKSQSAFMLLKNDNFKLVPL